VCVSVWGGGAHGRSPGRPAWPAPRAWSRCGCEGPTPARAPRSRTWHEENMCKHVCVCVRTRARVWGGGGGEGAVHTLPCRVPCLAGLVVCHVVSTRSRHARSPKPGLKLIARSASPDRASQLARPPIGAGSGCARTGSCRSIPPLTSFLCPLLSTFQSLSGRRGPQGANIGRGHINPRGRARRPSRHETRPPWAPIPRPSPTPTQASWHPMAFWRGQSGVGGPVF
jgi:hypothetical protein